jgi:hypothetical protein
MREAGIQYDLEQVNNQEKKTKSGTDYWTINAKRSAIAEAGLKQTRSPSFLQRV